MTDREMLKEDFTQGEMSIDEWLKFSAAKERRDELIQLIQTIYAAHYSYGHDVVIREAMALQKKIDMYLTQPTQDGGGET